MGAHQPPKPRKMGFKYELRACKIGSPQGAVVAAAVLLWQRHATESGDGRRGAVLAGKRAAGCPAQLANGI